MALEVKVDRLIVDVEKIATMLVHLEEVGVVRRIEALEQCDQEHDDRITTVANALIQLREDVVVSQTALRSEVTGALRVLRWGAAIVAFASILVILLNNSAALLHQIIGAVS